MKISVVIMASGLSTRFGENKLLYDFNGKPLVESTLKAVKDSASVKNVVVTRYDEIINLSTEYGFVGVYNADETNDLAVTIRLGVNEVKDSDGIMLCVADQPYLTTETINSLIAFFGDNPRSICAVAHRGQRGNPVIFPKSTFDELMRLQPFSGGKEVISKHTDLLKLLEIPHAEELFDVDAKSAVVRKPEDIR